MQTKLPESATLASVPLAKPEDYVIGAMKHMRACMKAHGNAFVRIGILGSGRTPYYRITYASSEGEKVFDSFWNNHVSFSEEGRATEGHDENWSTAAMTYDEVAAFRGTIKKKT